MVNSYYLSPSHLLVLAPGSAFLTICCCNIHLAATNQIAPAPGGSAIDSHVCFVMPCVSSNFDDTNSSSSAAIESNRMASTLELACKAGGLLLTSDWQLQGAVRRNTNSAHRISIHRFRAKSRLSSSNLIVRDSDLDVSARHAEWFPLIPLKVSH